MVCGLKSSSFNPKGGRSSTNIGMGGAPPSELTRSQTGTQLRASGLGDFGSGFRIWGFPKIMGTILGALIIRTIVYLGLCRGPLILGNYHLRVR